jgi:SH3-like domain-containing protein
MQRARVLLLLVSAATLLAPTLGFAFDFRSIGAEPAILYDAPTERGHKEWIAPRGMPVEVILVQGDWVRVRDSGGDFSWVKKDALSEQRTVLARGDLVVRATADDGAAVSFRTAPGVILDLVEPSQGGWLHVRHRDGSVGWVHVAEVWGD